MSVAITAKRGKHSCTKKFCATCNELVSFDHRCYIKVVEQVSKKANAETLQSNVSSFEGNFFLRDDVNVDDGGGEAEKSNKKKNGKPKQALKYVLFDFECTQDDGTHVPNLCVKKMFCELCAGQPAEYKCNTCTSRKIFKGNKTQSEFCEWLFQSPQTDNYVAIAHNAKGV